MLLRVHSPVADPEFLKGKYSESFIEEMKRQLTEKIARAMSVEGLEESTVELQLVFAPGTYMEHTSERVTYRRLLITDKSCGVRDFWVKWTRLDGAVAYTVADDVTADTILFEIGEDVPQKIREKEYRFLAFENPDKYQSAMSKKTVTEWRDLIKRAVKKGMLQRVECEAETVKNDDVSDKLKDLLSSYGIETAEKETVEEDNDAFEGIMALARAALEGEDAPETEQITKEPEDEEVIPEEPTLDETIEETVETVDIFDVVREEAPEQIIEEPIEEAIEEEVILTPTEDIATDIEEACPDCDEGEATLEEILDSLDEEEIEPPVVQKKVTVTCEPTEDASELGGDVAKLLEERIKRELEAKLRLEYEAKARERAEFEAESLRREQEQLRRENERLLALAREAEEAKSRREAELIEAEKRHKKEEEELRQKIEAQMQREARERDRLAEAARLAVLEHKRAEDEKVKDPVLEKTERPEPEKTAAPVTAPEEEKYLTKRAKLIFRSSVDANIIGRIKDVIEGTLISEKKTDVKMHLRAYPIDETTIGLDIVKMPPSEGELLVTLMKALGNARIGISKITVE